MRHPGSSFSSPFSLHRIAAAMSARHPYRGGRLKRSYSDRPPSTAMVSGDSHFQAVGDTNSGLRRNHNNNNNHNNSCNPHNLNYRYNNNNNNNNNHKNSNNPQNFNYEYNNNNNAPFNRRPNQSAAWSQPRPKSADFREWESAIDCPPPHFERFIVLSYNILADYLAKNHPHLYSRIPYHFMSWEWRKSNLLFELRRWSPDIMCFQEVDKFHELEEDLRRHGYSGIWKMRTGEPIDGCAIFWRTSRFKLVYEECIEYNKCGMRDNVAQVCVLESLLTNNIANKKLASSTSSEGPNRVVICNIHVLYNPRRGEIKLGQVRVLLERAQAVSRKWDDAPVVLCGDFNCTPKSPLYNFILEQKLDISKLERDKVSGQASAEIRSPYHGRGQSTGALASPTMVVDNIVDREDNQGFRKDAEKFLSELTNDEDPFPSDLGDMVVEDLSSTPNSEAVNVQKSSYDPSLWTQMEVATATGNANSTVVQHSLKLKSTYSEVEGCSGTRDSNGEPLVTSYHRRFMGTVDYIWRSEGLCTVKVLAPIRKDVLQQIGGLPSKKWGSDHIALASQLAFTK